MWTAYTSLPGGPNPRTQYTGKHSDYHKGCYHGYTPHGIQNWLKTQNPVAKRQITHKLYQTTLTFSHWYKKQALYIMSLFFVVLLFSKMLCTLCHLNSTSLPLPFRKKKKRVSSAYAPTTEFHVTMFGLTNTFVVRLLSEKNDEILEGRNANKKVWICIKMIP